MKSDGSLSAREVYQLLKDIALGVRLMRRGTEQGWSQDHRGDVELAVDGWRLTLYNEFGHLDHCSACTSADGRQGAPEAWARFGTDPTQLLSQWERSQLEALLHRL